LWRIALTSRRLNTLHWGRCFFVRFHSHEHRGLTRSSATANDNKHEEIKILHGVTYIALNDLASTTHWSKPNRHTSAGGKKPVFSSSAEKFFHKFLLMNDGGSCDILGQISQDLVDRENVNCWSK
jgi:hypothetical protein